MVAGPSDGSAPATPAPAGSAAPDAKSTPDPSGDDDHGEIAWRLRWARRGVLKDVVIPHGLASGDAPGDVAGIFGSSVFSSQPASARIAGNVIANMPRAGQFQLLTASSFDNPRQPF